MRRYYHDCLGIFYDDNLQVILAKVSVIFLPNAVTRQDKMRRLYRFHYSLFGEHALSNLNQRMWTENDFHTLKKNVSR